MGLLKVAFSEDKIQTALSSLDRDKAPKLDGFTLDF